MTTLKFYMPPGETITKESGGLLDDWYHYLAGIEFTSKRLIDLYRVASIDNSDSPYSAGDEGTILANATSGSITINLPAASTSVRKAYRIMKTDASANTVVVDGSGSETINGSTTNTISSQYGNIMIVTDNSNWFIF